MPSLGEMASLIGSSYLSVAAHKIAAGTLREKIATNKQQTKHHHQQKEQRQKHQNTNQQTNQLINQSNKQPINQPNNQPKASVDNSLGLGCVNAQSEEQGFRSRLVHTATRSPLLLTQNTGSDIFS